MNKTKFSHFSAIAVTFAFGIMAGFFWTYSFNVNYATIALEANEYAKVQSLFNVNVRHAMFFSFFFGGAVLCVVAIVFSWLTANSGRFWLLLIAGMLYTFGIIVFTREVNLPLNYQTEAWQLGAVPANWRAVRDAWNEANLLRTAVSAAAFLLAIVSLTCNSERK